MENLHSAQVRLITTPFPVTGRSPSSIRSNVSSSAALAVVNSPGRADPSSRKSVQAAAGGLRIAAMPPHKKLLTALLALSALVLLALPALASANMAFVRGAATQTVYTATDTGK